MAIEARITRTRAKLVQGSVVLIPVTMHWLWAPAGLLVAIPLPALIGSLLIPDLQFGPTFGQPSFLSLEYRLFAIASFAILAIVFFLAVPMSGRASFAIRLDAARIRWVTVCVRALSLVTFGSYAIWLTNAVARGLSVSSVVSLLSGEQGAMYALRNQYFESLGGVTTWMQLGALLAPLAILRERACGIRASRIIAPLIVLALVRAVLNSERLALIEILLSATMAIALLRPRAPRILRSPVSVLALIVIVWVGLISVFALFEYFRSWTYAEQTFEGGFVLYAVTLLLGYYATALNLAAFDRGLAGGQPLPSQLFDGNFWTTLFGPSPLRGYQRAYGLETFTNRSGLLVPEVAFGVTGGFLVIVATAVFIALLARAAARGGVVALAMYCGTSVAVLEIVRIYYLGSSRYLPVLIAGIVMAITWTLMRTKAHGPDTSPWRDDYA